MTQPTILAIEQYGPADGEPLLFIRALPAETGTRAVWTGSSNAWS